MDIYRIERYLKNYLRDYINTLYFEIEQKTNISNLEMEEKLNTILIKQESLESEIIKLNKEITILKKPIDYKNNDGGIVLTFYWKDNILIEKNSNLSVYGLHFIKCCDDYKIYHIISYINNSKVIGEEKIKISDNEDLLKLHCKVEKLLKELFVNILSTDNIIFNILSWK